MFAATGDGVVRLEGGGDGRCTVLFALNRRWEPPRWKWLGYHATTLDRAPPRLAERITATLLEADARLAHL